MTRLWLAIAGLAGLASVAAGAGRWLGWIAPFGGAALRVGWGALAVLALRRR